MNHSQAKFDTLYGRHVSALEHQGKADKTVEAYSRALKRLSKHFEPAPTTSLTRSSGLTSIP